MRLLIFALIIGRDRDLRRNDRGWREDRPILVDHLHVPVARDEFIEVWRRAAAIWAIIVEKGDNGDVALWVAADGRRWIAENARHEVGLLVRFGDRRGDSKGDERNQR